MSITLCEAVEYEGVTYISVKTVDDAALYCEHCAFYNKLGRSCLVVDARDKRPEKLDCVSHKRPDGNSVIWLREKDAFIARLRGSL